MIESTPFIPLSEEDAARFPANLDLLGHPDVDVMQQPAGYCCDGFQQAVSVKAIVWYPCSIGLWFVCWPEPQPISKPDGLVPMSQVVRAETNQVYVAGRVMSFCPDCGFQWATIHRGITLAKISRPRL